MEFESKRGSRDWNRTVLWCLLALMGLLVVPEGARAQGFRLLPQVGLYTPLSDLTTFTEGGESVFEAGKKSSTAALGLGIEFGTLRAQLGYATASDIPISGVGCASCEARSTLLTATVAAVLRPVPAILFLRPFVVLGGGIKRYDFDPGDLTEEEGWSAVFEDQTQFAGQLGLGAEFSILGFDPRIELSAYLSRFDSGEGPEGMEDDEFQTDLFLMIGIPIGS